MLNYMKTLQEKCFSTPGHSKERREINFIHQELNGRLRRSERARLQRLMDKTTALQIKMADDSFSAGFRMGWIIRGELQEADILSPELERR